MVFQEDSNYQFDNNSELVYQLPQGLNAIALNEKAFDITITDNEGELRIKDNTYRVQGGILYVQFNKTNSADFNRLAAVANLNFEVNINAEFDNSYTEIDFGNSVIKSFNYAVEATALDYAGDVAVKSNKVDPVNFTTTQYENGFQINIPSAKHQEVFTINYSAIVDYEKITNNGTVEQTQNTAWASATGLDPVSDTAHLEGKITFDMLSKNFSDPQHAYDNLPEVSYTIVVNGDHKKKMGGKAIKDSIGSESKHRLSFKDGIHVKVLDEDESVIREADLIWGEGSNLIGGVSLSNLVEVGDDATTFKKVFQVNNDNTLDLKKEAIAVSAEEITWRATATIPAAGINGQIYMEDALPAKKIGSAYHYDTIEDTVNDVIVSGLEEAEDCVVKYEKNKLKVSFFKDKAHNEAGLLRTADGNNREITVQIKTKVNPTWFETARDNGYNDYLRIHKNTIDVSPVFGKCQRG